MDVLANAQWILNSTHAVAAPAGALMIDIHTGGTKTAELLSR